MNYIWDVFIKAKNLGIQNNIIFKYPKRYSPYIEVSFVDLNKRDIKEDKEIEVNPYYRFHQIFKNMFLLDNKEDENFREILFDILIHYLAIIDIKQGLYKGEFYKRFILNDIKEGNYFDELKEYIDIFTFEEKDNLLNHLLMLYKSSNNIELFKSIVRKIFDNSIVYLNKENKNEILIYLGEYQNFMNQKKIDLLIEIFLNIKYKVLLYFEYHFGINGVDNTMKIENMVIY
ncbi:MAG: hypothetical protein N4A54_06525 [Peptostreptococcaceae bacterium]|jgi:hypothetical protein|nr:hypothetical protein [Peptostreptococcaceae bacterium]